MCQRKQILHQLPIPIRTRPTRDLPQFPLIPKLSPMPELSASLVSTLMPVPEALTQLRPAALHDPSLAWNPRLRIKRLENFARLSTNNNCLVVIRQIPNHLISVKDTGSENTHFNCDKGISRRPDSNLSG
ncbi:hypothetical protein BBP40_001014 [Aspergillus hancockii]|nr:hypothetical protein BBP40_001014 [Aspergillus hancockii]